MTKLKTKQNHKSQHNVPGATVQNDCFIPKSESTHGVCFFVKSKNNLEQPAAPSQTITYRGEYL